MTRYPEYLRYLEEAKRAEIADTLRSEGFSVETEKQIGDVRFDLFAQKGNHSLVYEFKSVGSKRLTRDELVKLQRSAKESGYEFHMVVVNPPPRVTVEVENLASELLDYAINGTYLDDIQALSGNTIIDNITDLDISDIRVSDSGTKVKGTGTIDVILEYGGGESKDGATMSDAYPFRFAVSLEPDGSLASVDEFVVDTSSFYE
jgi:hypothetical protein